MTGGAPALPDPPLEVLWNYRTGEPINGGAVVDQGLVCVGDMGGVVHGVDRETGRRRWTYKARAPVSATPLIAGGRVYVGDWKGWFHCLDLATGRLVWQVEADMAIKSSANLAAGRILFGSEDNLLYACDDRGRITWRVETGNQVIAPPAVAGELLYLSGCDGVLRCLRAASGEEAWSRDFGAYAPASPLLLGERCLVATLDGRVACLSRDGTRELWLHRSPEASYLCSPAGAGGVVVVGSNKDWTVTALDLASGRELWTVVTRGPVEGAPVIAGDLVVVGSGDGKLRFLDLKSGAGRWEFLAGHAILASPAPAGDRLLCGDRGGNLWCLGRP